MIVIVVVVDILFDIYKFDERRANVKKRDEQSHQVNSIKPKKKPTTKIFIKSKPFGN